MSDEVHAIVWDRVADVIEQMEPGLQRDILRRAYEQARPGPVAELADAPASRAGAARREGSTPSGAT